MNIISHLLTFLGPVLLGFSITYAYLFLKKRNFPKDTGEGFPVPLALVLGVAGAGITLAGTIVWMVWYESTTGFSAGNAPLGWIFITGPGGIALSVIVGFIVWQLAHGKRGRDLIP